MIVGVVSGRHAVVRLTVRDRTGRPGTEVDFILDTGFAGFLTLPAIAAQALALPSSHQRRARLADGRVVRLAVHQGAVLWDGNELQVEILATGGEALLGTALLDGYETVIQWVDGGLVQIEKI